MILDIDEGDLKSGVLALVMALVEIIRDTLSIQAVRRLEGGSLTDCEADALGQALMALDGAIEEVKRELGVADAVAAVRDGLDDLVSDAIGTIVGLPGGRRPEARVGAAARPWQ